ncbi:MAG: hypothetical protein U0228_25935 [Myxococcaceae bacterium]
MLSFLVAFALAAPPSPAAPLEALRCKTRKCKVTRENSVWKVTLPGVKEVDGVTCHEPPQEWWYVGADGTGQLLLAVCNDGYGASGVGEDDVKVDAKTFTHSRYGGSAWRWTSETVVGLSPLRVVSESSQSFHTSMPNCMSTTSWSWDTFSGTTQDDVPACTEQGGPDGEGDPVTTRSTLVPSLQLPEEYLAGDWKRIALGDCSAPASFVTFGKQTGAGDASLRAVVSGTELFLEVRDDVFVEKAAKWTLADHVELWLADLGDPWTTCAATKGGQQWGLALDGTVNAGFGAPRPLKVEVARGDGLVRFHVTLPAAPQRLTVVYSDTDDGKKQKALLATSALKFGLVTTLGAVRLMQPEDAVCEVLHDALTPKRTRVLQPSTPLIR